MRRMSCLCALLVFTLIGTAQRPVSADDTPATAQTGLAGTWKLTFYTQGQSPTLWLIGLEESKGKWTGKVAATGEQIPPSRISELTVAKGEVRFEVSLGQAGGQSLAFQGKLSPKDPNRVRGTLDMRGNLLPAELIRTDLKTLSAYDLARERLAEHPTGALAVDTVLTLLREAADRHIKADEVKKWAATGAQAAAPYGKAMQSYFAADVAMSLSEDKELRPIAIEYAQSARKLLGPDMGPDMREPILVKLLRVFQAAGNKGEVQQVEKALRQVQTVQTTRYTGRKGNGNRVVLVELFTGAQCPPCVAADIAFDGLTQTFKPSEVVFLEYHLNIPGPDPMTNPSTEERLAYYGEAVRGTPTLLLDGKLGPQGGGFFAARQQKYTQYYKAITPLLNQQAGTTLTAIAVRQRDKINVTTELGPVPPAPDLRVRLALVEREIYYTGTNGITADRQVVRGFVGGAQGLALTKTGKLSASLDLAKLRKDLEKYQADFVKQNGPYPGTAPPFQLKDLEVVAFVQNDKTKQVLQALHVPIRGEGAAQSQ